jgi:hypothetical protein
MEGVPECFEQPIDRAEFRRAQGCEGVELYRAHIVTMSSRRICTTAMASG